VLLIFFAYYAILFISSGTMIQLLAALPPDLSTLQNIIPALSEQRATEAAQLATESVQHTMNVTIIATNRSFLIAEINTNALVRAFKDKGITCFEGLDGTLGRQQRAEDFLTILERNNLLDQLLHILREQGMAYVLDRLNNCRHAYSAGLYFVNSCLSPYLYLLSYKQPSACEFYVQIVVLTDIYI
jgi:hypothetical protein